MGMPPSCNPCCNPQSPPPSSSPSGSPESGSGAEGCCPDGSGGQLVFANAWKLSFTPNADLLAIFPMWPALAVWVNYSSSVPQLGGQAGWYGAISVLLPHEPLPNTSPTRYCDITCDLIGLWNCNQSLICAHLAGATNQCNGGWGGGGFGVYEAYACKIGPLSAAGWCPTAFDETIIGCIGGLARPNPCGNGYTSDGVSGGEMILAPNP